MPLDKSIMGFNFFSPVYIENKYNSFQHHLYTAMHLNVYIFYESLFQLAYTTRFQQYYHINKNSKNLNNFDPFKSVKYPIYSRLFI